MKAFAAATLAVALAWAAPARASTLPLLDLPAGVKTVTLGVSDTTVHGSFDLALWGIAEGFTVGLAGGGDWRDPYGRDTNTMLALRVGRRIVDMWPTTFGVLVSGGANLVDPTKPLPRRTAQRFDSDFLLWAQPAAYFSTAFENEKIWLRMSVGPVFGRETEGLFVLPWISPAAEVAYRYNSSVELVVGGGYASPYSLGLRGAF